MNFGNQSPPSVGRVVVITSLCSISAIGAYTAVYTLTQGARPKPQTPDPDADTNQAKAKQPTAAGKSTGGKTAIAKPEKIAVKPSANPTRSSQWVKAGTPVPLALRPEYTIPARLLPTSTRSIATPESLGLREPTNPDSLSTGLSPSLRDIEGHWSQYYVDFLVSRNIIQGFPDSTFRPERSITAGEFDSMMQRAFPNSKMPISYSQFRSLSGRRSVTRAEAAVYVYRTILRNEPQISVTSVRVQGEVDRPGGYSLAAASDARIERGRNLPTVSRAIQQAGGRSVNANLRQVEIHRTTDTGTQKVYKVDVSNMLETGDFSQDILLQQNDKLVIPSNSPTAQAPTPKTTSPVPKAIAPTTAQTPTLPSPTSIELEPKLELIN
jgi:S-layer homology domain